MCTSKIFTYVGALNVCTRSSVTTGKSTCTTVYHQWNILSKHDLLGKLGSVKNRIRVQFNNEISGCGHGASTCNTRNHYLHSWHSTESDGRIAYSVATALSHSSKWAWDVSTFGASQGYHSPSFKSYSICYMLRQLLMQLHGWHVYHIPLGFSEALLQTPQLHIIESNLLGIVCSLRLCAQATSSVTTGKSTCTTVYQWNKLSKHVLLD